MELWRSKVVDPKWQGWWWRDCARCASWAGGPLPGRRARFRGYQWRWAPCRQSPRWQGWSCRGLDSDNSVQKVRYPLEQLFEQKEKWENAILGNRVNANIHQSVPPDESKLKMCQSLANNLSDPLRRNFSRQMASILKYVITFQVMELEFK